MEKLRCRRPDHFSGGSKGHTASAGRTERVSGISKSMSDGPLVIQTCRHWPEEAEKDASVWTTGWLRGNVKSRWMSFSTRLRPR